MRTFGFRGLTNAALLRELAELFARDCAFTAELVACVGEVETRKLYLEAGYPSMYKYCIGEYHLGEQAAYKRIQAARAARRFPVILAMIADGRLHLSAVVLLKPHLAEATAGDLLAAATHKTSKEIERLLAGRFPKPEAPTRIEPLMPQATGTDTAPPAVPQLSSRIVATHPSASPCAPAPADATQGNSATCDVGQHAPAHDEILAPRPKVAPLSAECFAIQFTIDQSTYEKLQHVQRLLGHRIPPGDLAQVFDRALGALVTQLEKRKFAATEKPRPVSRESSDDPRHIPAYVQRAVWKRDQGRCAFVSESGRRCTAREDLEYDHVEPVARGGRATVAGIRLLCRNHNQYEAERAFGTEFMENKRQEARRATMEPHAKAAARESGAKAGSSMGAVT